ncbi:hypothetical protein AQUCO_00500629v1 [Aquilegia coerulea]|uniref:Uncharacterized protein n=1 Tax=Aquilegia coerulea TaxID=218851 RepID=A0A2G5ESW0_AQUCA|nr:hypothetical protein AQUCO_00500629v1 [Aquilegia coerulea]
MTEPNGILITEEKSPHLETMLQALSTLISPFRMHSTLTSSFRHVHYHRKGNKFSKGKLQSYRIYQIVRHCTF